MTRDAISFHASDSEVPIYVYAREACDLPANPVASLQAEIRSTEASNSHDLFATSEDGFRLIHDSQQVQWAEGLGPVETLVYTSERGVWHTENSNFGSGALEWGYYCGPDLVAEEPSADNMEDSQQWVFSRGGNIFFCPTVPCLASDEIQLTWDPTYWDHEPRLYDHHVVFTRRIGPGLMETAVVLTEAWNPGAETWIATYARRPDIHRDWVAYEQWRPDPAACSYPDGESYHTQIHVYGPLSGQPTASQAIEGGGHPDDPDYLGRMRFERPRLTETQLLFIRTDRENTTAPSNLYTYPVTQSGSWTPNLGAMHIRNVKRDQIFDAWDEENEYTAVVFIQASGDLMYGCFSHW